MFRIIAGIIVGLLVTFILVAATFLITILAMGLENTFQPNSYWTTDTFNIIVLVGGFIAAIAAGMVCGLIARNSKAAFALAVIILAMGTGSAVMQMNKPDPPVRTEPVTLEGIQAHGKEPTWFAFSKVALAVVGVMIGSSLVSKKNAARSHSNL